MSSTGRISGASRVVAAVVAIGCLGLLLLAGAMRADADGHGTHQQLGLPPCGWVIAFDAPCPTCGMTTSFAHAAAGDPIAGIVNQPMGGLLAVATAMVFVGAAHAALFGVNPGPLLKPLRRPLSLWVGIGSILASWVYKIVTWE